MTDTVHVRQVGPYLLDEVVGRGSSGVVYRAWDETDGSVVAVKLLDERTAEDPMTRARFVRECELVGAFSHPGLVGLRARGRTETGLDYLVMDLALGPSLAERVGAGPPLDEATAVRVALSVADGLAAMHREGWVHRDVKPANIVLDEDDRPRLLDFGLAARFGAGSEPRLTQAGFFVGTPLYLAPETLVGGNPAATMDVYALGAVLFELLAGRPPFEGSTEQILAQKTTRDAPCFDGAESVARLLASALAREPRERPPDAAAFAAELRATFALEVETHDLEPGGRAEGAPSRPSGPPPVESRGIDALVARVLSERAARLPREGARPPDPSAEPERAPGRLATVLELEELLELDRLEAREGELAPPLRRRRAELERWARPRLLGHATPPGVLAHGARRRSPPSILLPPSSLGLDAPAGRRGLGVMGALGVIAAGALGPLSGIDVRAHLLALAGPLVVAALAWFGLYPWRLHRSERRARGDGAPPLAGEGLTLGVGGLCLGGAWGLLELDLLTAAAAGVMFLGFGAAATAVARPAARIRALRQVAALAEDEGAEALARMDASEAREALEVAVALGCVSAEGPLRVAALLEAEAWVAAGRGGEGKARLVALGIDERAPEAARAVRAWAARTRAPVVELLEAGGLYAEAARGYRETGRYREAGEAYRTLARRSGPGAERDAALRGLVEVGGRLVDDLLEEVLEEVRNRGTAARGALGVLAALPSTELDRGPVYEGLQEAAAAMPPDRTIAILEGVVGARKPTELPAVHALLAAAYRAVGHAGTARRIEAEIGPAHRAPSSETGTTPPVGRALELDTSDLAGALEERYGLLGRLGQGAMGTVYLAEDLVLGRRVALKVLSPRMANELFVSKFREEARIVASLDHPGIVRIHDAGQAGPFTFFVMELVEGRDLASRLLDPDAPPLSARVRWIAEVAEAMAYAHACGVVHRDLKPANVLVADATGAARVTDFGIAHAGRAAPDATGFGRAGLQVGTPTYMAPEQLGHGARASAATDVYALGVTGWFALTGELPFGDDPLRKLNAPAPDLKAARPDISDVVADVVRAALAPDPAHRLESMRDVAARLRGAPEIDRRPGRRRADRATPIET